MGQYIIDKKQKIKKIPSKPNTNKQTKEQKVQIKPNTKKTEQLLRLIFKKITWVIQTSLLYA